MKKITAEIQAITKTLEAKENEAAKALETATDDALAARQLGRVMRLGYVISNLRNVAGILGALAETEPTAAKPKA